MNDGLQTLVELGEADARVFDLILKLRRFPEHLAEAKRQLDVEQRLLDEVLKPWQRLDDEIAEREATIKIALETIDKFEAHMTQVTTQKEYMAARKQVDEARRLNTRLQDEILERRVKQEELNPQLTERQSRHAKVLESYQAEEAVILKDEDALKQEMAAHEAHIHEQLKTMGDRVEEHYNRLIKAGKRPAIAPVVAGSCHGCRMALPPQVYNQLLANNGNLFTCPTCSRIIFHPPREQEAEKAPAAAAS